MNWFIQALGWYLYLFIIGILFAPIASRIFSKFPDKGYPFAKTIGIISISYAIFLFGLLKILPFSKESLYLILITFIILIFKFFHKDIVSFKLLSKKQVFLIVFEEVFFLASLIFLAYIRAHEPNIHGLEKFMDFGFMQSIQKSQFFPPIDMWFSADPTHPEGYPINYYWFGHLTGAVLIKLTAINPFIGYNLILATIFAQGMTLVFSITGSMAHIVNNLKKKTSDISLSLIMTIGLLGAFIVNLAGNLHTIYIFTWGYPNDQPVPFWTNFQTIQDVLRTMTSTGKDFIESLVENSKYWYPNATRFIPFTIHEFPSYSYVVADLHGHVFGIPLVLLTIGLIIEFFISKHQEPKQQIHKITNKFLYKIFQKIHALLHRIIPLNFHYVNIPLRERIFILLIGAMIAVNYMTNAFDGPIYMLFALLILFSLYRISWKFLIQSATLLASFYLFSLPFSANFELFATGIGVNCSFDFLVSIKNIGPFFFEKGNCQVSPIWMMLVLWGFFWISALSFSIYIFFKKRFHDNITYIDFLLAIIFIYGTFLLIIPEFVYIKDIYPAHFRANTMFKLGYQAYIMMGIASTIGFFLIARWKSKIKYFLLVIFSASFFLISIYPFLAFPSYYPKINETKTDENTKEKSKKLDLNGQLWMQDKYTQDMEIINFINKNIPNQPVILEAQGDSYTDYNRVSAYTGNPTVAGWWVHEWLWRGSSDVVGKRIPDIEALYQSEDMSITQQLIDKYQIEYVVVSEIEREKYKYLNEGKFTKIGYKIFESNNGLGALYKVY